MSNTIYTLSLEKYDTRCIADDFTKVPFEKRKIVSQKVGNQVELTYERYVEPSWFAQLVGCLCCCKPEESNASTGLAYTLFLAQEYDDRTLYMVKQLLPGQPYQHVPLLVQHVLDYQGAINRWKQVEAKLRGYSIKAAIVHHFSGGSIAKVRDTGNDVESEEILAALLELEIHKGKDRITRAEIMGLLSRADLKADQGGGLFGAIAREIKDAGWTIGEYPLFYDREGNLLESPLELGDEELFMLVQRLLDPRLSSTGMSTAR